MTARHLGTVLALAVFAALIWVAGNAVGAVPPLGPLLDPVHGVWAVAGRTELPRESRLAMPSLERPVEIVYDDRGVPHIFAESELDAYRALGYAVARDRLFQLEVQARAGAGTLTSLVGAVALEADQRTRAGGSPRAAAQKLAALDTAETPYKAIIAYAEGVNAWIDALRPADLPLEYRLLGVQPARWLPINTVHLLNRMAWTLAYDDQDLRRLRASSRVGSAAAAALFPRDMPVQEPIEPAAGPYPRWDAHQLPPPGTPDTAAVLMSALMDDVLPGRAAREADVLGSNNWAVSPRRTRDGFALLAGDPHLELTLPSIWYEAHLVVRGRLDVYGVTIPGSPWVVIGLNRDIAWTFTNTGADVMDFYRETVDDSSQPTRYLLDGEWRPLEQRVEEYRGRRGEILRTDTIRFSHRGPLRRAQGAWHSMRWTALEPSTEPNALDAASRARDAEGFLDAMLSFQVPAQNMLVADRSGTIAIRSTGRFPLRPDDDGSIIRDGSTTAADWTGDWPGERYPQAVNPTQGFLVSANQQPKDPRSDSGYMGANWPSPWRAIRINEILRADSLMTPDRMRVMQTDPISARAAEFVPFFLAAASRRGIAGDENPDLRDGARVLAGWDRGYGVKSRGAVLFEAVMQELALRTWDELADPRADPSLQGRRVAIPPEAVLSALLRDPANTWWNVSSTSTVETRDDILVEALAAGYRRTVDRLGPADGDAWLWGRVHSANIYHLLRLPSLSALYIPVQAGPSTISPSSGRGTDGASWRMVVELGPDLRAWGTYPGGQSGNPVSARYTDRLGTWTRGELDTLRLPRSSAELIAPRRRATVTLRPAR